MDTSQILVDYYKVLQSERTASTEQLKKNYQRLALSSHPDKQTVPDSENFALIHKAWSVLRDPESRKQYDASLTCQDHSEMLLYDTISLREMDFDADKSAYKYSCRCGGTYVLELSDSMPPQIVINCDECSFSVQIVSDQGLEAWTNR